MSGRSLATRYWDSLTGRYTGTVVPVTPRGRAGYGLGRRYLASLLGVRLPEIPEPGGDRAGLADGDAPAVAPQSRGQWRVLVVDADPATGDEVRLALQDHGYETVVLADGERAQAEWAQIGPDVVILELALPGVDGSALSRTIRARSDVPILIVSDRADPVDVVLGLESGADDYLIKPFQRQVLLARVRAVQRRTAPSRPPTVTVIGGLTIDQSRHVVVKDGREIPLTPLEFDLLVALARKPRQVFTREVLLEQVWGYRHAADTRLVNVHVQRLRAKLEDDPEHPEVIRAVGETGFRLDPD